MAEREVTPWWIALALFAVVVGFFLLSRASEKVAPQPVALWVAVQPEGEEVAKVGWVELPAGSGFRLHAVMEAETFRGERVFYTEARQLDFFGDAVASDVLSPWSGHLEARILWFTIEGAIPYREASSDEELTAPRFQSIFQPDWGRAWSVVGQLRPTVENYLPGFEGVRRGNRFGTQRFQVRVELFRDRDDLVPELRLASWGPEDLPGRSADFPTVVVELPGPLAEPSRVFGLPQVEVASGETSTSVAEQLTAWTREMLAFSRVSVLGAWIAARGTSWEELAWENVELGASDRGARPGDLLRVGRRLVWLLEDRGDPGLDDEDLCLDLERGARVHRLGDVFVGEGLVDWAPAPRSDS